MDEIESVEMSANIGASISIATSVKGITTYRATVYAETIEQALEKSDRLVAELNKRYPPVVEDEPAEKPKRSKRLG